MGLCAADSFDKNKIFQKKNCKGFLKNPEGTVKNDPMKLEEEKMSKNDFMWVIDFKIRIFPISN